MSVTLTELGIPRQVKILAAFVDLIMPVEGNVNLKTLVHIDVANGASVSLKGSARSGQRDGGGWG